MTYTYAILIRPTDTGFCCHVPDLPVCVGTAPTIPELKVLMHDAMKMHIELLRERGEAIPPPTTLAEYIEVPE